MRKNKQIAQNRISILTLDDDPNADYAGIRRINALEWLIGKA